MAVYRDQTHFTTIWWFHHGMTLHRCQKFSVRNTACLCTVLRHAPSGSTQCPWSLGWSSSWCGVLFTLAGEAFQLSSAEGIHNFVLDAQSLSGMHFQCGFSTLSLICSNVWLVLQVGIILGLAIYNGVILDVQFPLVVYKKLLGGDPALGPPLFHHASSVICRSAKG